MHRGADFRSALPPTPKRTGWVEGNRASKHQASQDGDSAWPDFPGPRAAGPGAGELAATGAGPSAPCLPRTRARPPLLSPPSRSPCPAGRRALPAGILVPPTRSSGPAPPFARSASLSSHTPPQDGGALLWVTLSPRRPGLSSPPAPPAPSRPPARSLIRALGRLHASSPLVYLVRTVAPPSASPRRCSPRSHLAVVRPRQQPSGGGSGDIDDSDVAQGAGFLRRSAGPA